MTVRDLNIESRALMDPGHLDSQGKITLVDIRETVIYLL